MSDAVQIALIAGASAAAQSLVIAAFNYARNRKRDRIVDDIHTLVNSGMGEQLLIGMVAAKNLAYAKPTAENIELANAAEQKYKKHEAKQARVDLRMKESLESE
jgi:hypothetical protein